VATSDRASFVGDPAGRADAGEDGVRAAAPESGAGAAGWSACVGTGATAARVAEADDEASADPVSLIGASAAADPCGIGACACAEADDVAPGAAVADDATTS
jgi:hypothetical protein